MAKSSDANDSKTTVSANLGSDLTFSKSEEEEITIEEDEE